MNGFFKYDGPFYRFGSMLGDVMILTVLWFVCSIPLVTLGASTTALYYAMTKRVGGGDGGVTRDFFSSFRKEFLRATAAFVLLAAAIFFVLWAVRAMRAMTDGAELTAFHYIFQAVVYVDLIEMVFIAIFLFPILARFDMGFGQLLKTTFFMANKHILTTLMCALTLAFTLLLVQLNGFLLIIAPGLYSFMSSYFFLRVFRKYRPEIIKTVTEELQPLNLDDKHDANESDESHQ